jgi:phage gp46-like protein
VSDLRTLLLPAAPGRWPAFDLGRAPPGLAEDDGLETAVILSLFTDRRAEDDDIIPDGTADRRGWWADAWPEIAGDRIGSRLWLLSREKQRREVLNRAREYAREALAWLVADGIARAIEVEAEIARPGVLGLSVRIDRPARPPARYRFDLFWTAP